MLKRLLFAVAALLTLGTASIPVQARQAAQQQGGAVSAADPRAAAAGVEMLRAGGSAADAAFATMLALTVVEPQSSGIGGGGFLIYHDQRRGRLSSYDGRETAPRAATPAYFLDANGQPRGFRDVVAGGMSVGVPGNIRLIELGHRRHGRLPWARLFQPAIRLASDGFAITPRLYNALAAQGSLGGFSAWGRQQFYLPDGTPKPVGTVLRNPELAALLTRIARRGPQAFYTGPDAEALVRTVREASRNPHRLSGAGARAGLRPLPDLPGLRHGAGLLGRHHRLRHPEAAGALQPARHGPQQCRCLAPDRRIDAPRLCRPRRLAGR
jgi:gamma-glutamyltranspeptidase/glutathione hydrolase